MDDQRFDPHADIRFRPIDRTQIIGQSLDQLLPQDHAARIIVAFVDSLDFTPLYQTIKARHGHAGAPPYDPRLLFSLWLLATVEGIPSARQLEQRCQRDLPYLWLCGGLAPCYHTLSTFYTEQATFLDATFTDILATLQEKGLITPTVITFDGRKVTANASKESLHRAPTLNRHYQEAQERVATLRQLRTEAATTSSQQAAAQKRAAEERQQRLEAALATVRQRQAERQQSGRSKPEEARASTTDADARKMKRSDGGFKPSFNVQTATDEASGLIVTVAVYEQASDNGLLRPMVDQVEERTQTPVEQAVADSGFSDAADVEALEKRGTQVLMPPKNEKKEREKGLDPYKAKRRDTPWLAQWRQRMGTVAARELYSRRAPVAEGVHAQQSNRGWKQFRLRGLVKAGTEALWQALGHNLCVLMAKKWLGTGGILRPQLI